MGVADQIVASRFSSIDLSNKALFLLKGFPQPLELSGHYQNR